MKKILVLNNDMDTMTLLKTWLERKNYEVKYTASGEQALKIIKEFTPDLLLADVLHKRTVSKLKADESTNNLPIILMTGYTLKQNYYRHLAVVDDVIEKPFEPELLERKIERCLKNTG